VNKFNSIFGRTDNYLFHKTSTIFSFYADGTVLFTKMDGYLADSLFYYMSKWFYKDFPELKSGSYSIDGSKILLSIDGSMYRGIIVNKFTVLVNSYLYTYRGFIRDRHFVDGLKNNDQARLRNL